MSEAAVAQRYARAIFELGIEENQLDTLSQQVTVFAEAYRASPALANVLENPLIAAEKRGAVLLTLADKLGVRGLSLNAIRLLAQRHRLVLLPEIARLLSELSDERSGVVRATVRSAAPLGAAYLEGLQQQLSQVTQRRVVIEYEQDPELIAGLVTQIGDQTIDGSIQGRLLEIERQLLNA
jgi:F-type H+-transporting ATPase subunit delta